MRVFYSDQREVPAAQDIGAEYHPLEAVQAEANFLSLHTPLTPDTRHLVDAGALKRMKPTWEADGLSDCDAVKWCVAMS
jgi:lactate dehydrogenase-like 2-hydroxyacid dehydrogenase